MTTFREAGTTMEAFLRFLSQTDDPGAALREAKRFFDVVGIQQGWAIQRPWGHTVKFISRSARCADVVHALERNPQVKAYLLSFEPPATYVFELPDESPHA